MKDHNEKSMTSEAMSRNAAEYQSLFEAAAIGIAEIRLDTARFVRANRRFCQLIGYSETELLGMTFLDITHPDDRGLSLEVIHPFMQQRIEICEIETRYVRKDEVVVWVHLTGTMIRDECGHAVRLLVSVQDITERKAAEVALRTRTAQLNFALASTGVGMWLNTLPLGKLDWDERTRELFFVPPNVDATAGLFWSRLHPDDREPTRLAVESALRDKTLYAIDHRAVNPATGEVRWIRSAGQATYTEDGTPIRFDGVNYDITERKQTEAALRDSEEKYRFLVNAVPSLVWSCSADGTTDYHNDRWYEYTGLDPNSSDSEDWRQVVHPDDIGPAIERWTNSLKTGERYQTEYRLRRASDGQYLWWQAEAIPMRDKNGQITRWFGTCTNVNERHLAEEELQAADRRKDEFIAILAHELRNPLAPIRNAVQILKVKGPQDPELMWCRDIIDRQVAQMSRLLDDLLDISRITRNKLALRLSRVPLNVVIESAVETSRPLIDQMRQQLVVRMPTESVMLEADATRLAQVFSNLLSNAAKYSNPQSRIWLTSVRQGDDLIVSVKDEGIGIVKDHLEQVFEMFSQEGPAIERSQGGLGIGLSLVRGLVELHGGTVEAKSEGPGKGSEFLVRLPLRDRSITSETPQYQVAAAKIALQILVVDDNRDGAQSLSRMLKLEGHVIQTAYDGLAAVEAACKFQPDVILLDIGLPKMSGYEVCKLIRQEPWGKKMFIIAQTGWGQEEDRQKAQAAGFNHHLVKPLDIVELLTLLSGITPT